MLFSQKHLQKGFTLIEMVIVLVIIGILMGISLFPYNSYMEQSRLNNYMDSLAQEWILSHKMIRNGLIMPESENHASIVWIFDEKNNAIQLYTTALKAEELTSEKINNMQYSSDFQLFKKISLENKIHFLGENFENNEEQEFHYIISPPNASGQFVSTNDHAKTFYFGYKDAKNADSPRIKKITLRPYLQ